MKDVHEQIDHCVNAARTKAGEPGDGATPWGCRATPVFPAEWPLNKGSGLVAYGYFHRNPRNSADLEQQVGPFCKVLINPAQANEATTEECAFDANDIANQGFRPVAKGAAPSASEIQAMLIDVAGGKKAGDDDLKSIKSYYRDWRSNNGLMAERIARYHDTLFAWLDAD